MYYFLNDYSDLAHPKLLQELLDLNDNLYSGYGFDTETEMAKDLIKQALDDQDVDIHFVPGGTGANILCATAGLRPEESVISAYTGHIQEQEAGAIEATGTRIEPVEAKDGKLTVEILDEFLETFGRENVTVPKTVYISNTSELGTVYSKEELKKLYRFCQDNNLYLYIDGARMIHALTSPDSNLEFEDLTSLCDIFTIGGTKTGLLFGEIVVIKNTELKRSFLNLMKQKGAMMAKTFVLGAMFKKAFEDPEFIMDLGDHAYEMSKRLAKGLVEKGYTLAYPHSSNQVFVELDKTEYEKISSIAKVTDFRDTDQGKIVRFITTYRTTAEEIDNFLKEI